MKKILPADSTLPIFKSLFGIPAHTSSAPGRVNIIGEHTDYNDGFVLPAAIDKTCTITVGKNEDETINLFAAEMNEHASASIPGLIPVAAGWPNYMLGVADQLMKRNYPIKGFNAVISGDIPIGAGLSSSAAVECATAIALNELFELHISTREMVDIAQKAEHTFAGVHCGIMDQFASIYGKANHVIKLDCRTLEYGYVPLQMTGYKIVLLNTNVKHSLASSEYNQRRIECEKGVAMVKKNVPSVKSLRDVTLAMLAEYVKPVDELIYKRCKYVVEENIRLMEGTEDLKKGNLEGLGQKMFATHEGLKNDYEVSCKELDYLVDFVSGNKQVAGARMMGGGFGGCTINIVRENAVDDLIVSASEAYNRDMKNNLETYIAETSDGASVIASY